MFAKVSLTFFMIYSGLMCRAIKQVADVAIYFLNLTLKGERWQQLILANLIALKNY